MPATYVERCDCPADHHDLGGCQHAVTTPGELCAACLNGCNR